MFVQQKVERCMSAQHVGQLHSSPSTAISPKPSASGLPHAHTAQAQSFKGGRPWSACRRVWQRRARARLPLRRSRHMHRRDCGRRKSLAQLPRQLDGALVALRARHTTVPMFLYSLSPHSLSLHPKQSGQTSPARSWQRALLSLLACAVARVATRGAP